MDIGLKVLHLVLFKHHHMANPLMIEVKENEKELRRLLKQSSAMMHPRIKMLVAIKKAGEKGISKRQLMSDIGVCSQSIHNWRTAYKTGGIPALLSNGRKGKAGRRSIFTGEEHQKIERKLKDSGNGLAGYVELKEWVEQEFGKKVKYNTLLKYSVRHFGSSVKTARKSHVNKDAKAVEALKKTSSKK